MARTSSLGLRISSFLRVSDFGFRICALLAAFWVSATQTAPACGPFFPNNLLDRGDAAVLVAPEADFARELERMKLATSRFEAKPLQAGERHANHADQSLEAEMGDLLTALQKAKLPPEEVERIRAAHQKAREALKKYLADYDAWRRTGEWNYDHAVPCQEEPKDPPPKFPRLEVVPGLPGEFADYFEGALAWHNPALADKGLAREAWERLLERPPAERKFKSTWAAFMLGKSWQEEAPDKALDYFQQVRELAKRGFMDSLGLAAASLGLEARIYLKRDEYERAIGPYLEQFATGDTTALSSLRQVAVRVLRDADDAVLQRLAADSRAQRVITAFLVSQRGAAWDADETAGETSHVPRWLKAVEAAGVREVESAEKLALAAYQAGQIELAQRWIKRAPESPVAQWLQAKLLLRAGKVEPAAALLAKVSRSFPAESPDPRPPGSFAECLHVITGDYDCTTARRQILGELGALHLARRQFIEALNALLHAGYWMDAAYVAERVLTVDELQRYVDREWPEVPLAANEQASSKWLGTVAPAQVPREIRYLLARRLTRLNRGFEAREYFPPEWQPAYDALMQSLTLGWDDTQATSQRAAALYAAAFITRTNGLELLGTEVEPDWAIHGGNFEEGVTATVRTNENFDVLRASAEELRRAFAHTADPEARFHYRYQAAFLAWEAAKLMPDNSDETARVLCIAGSWLKKRDPQTADIFYKALVRRCRKTAIGDQADRMRWFPVLDENGNPKPWKPNARKTETVPTEAEVVSIEMLPLPLEPPSQWGEDYSIQKDNAELLSQSSELGYEYVVRAGDNLPKIVKAYNEHGIPVTVNELRQANPGLEAAPLQVGQRILIPAAKAAEPAKPAG